MEEILGIVKDLVSPTEKLIDAVQGAIGKAYEPRHVRKMAEAKAYEIEKVGQAMRENSDIAITYDKGSLELDTTDFDMFVKRAQNRLAYQELTKQKNIEKVVETTYSNLKDGELVLDEPVDNDWMLRFFNDVEDIGNEEMQYIWAKVLAGEIKHPKSVSLRTLSVLKNLGQNEATEFKQIVTFVLRAPGNKSKDVEDYFLLSDILDKYGFEYSILERLSDAGLIFTTPGVATYINISSDSEEYVIGKDKKLRIYNKSDNNIYIQSPAYTLTQAGKELYKTVFLENSIELPNEYIEDCLNILLSSIKKEDVITEILPI